MKGKKQNLVKTRDKQSFLQHLKSMKNNVVNE